MDQDKANHINAWLALKYGCNYDGQPKYRLILGSTQLEWRHGYFLEWADLAGFYEVEDTRLVQKYNHINADVWVLEKLDVYNPARFPDLVNIKPLHYEAIWTFHNTKTWKAVEPLEADIDMFVYFDINKTLKGHEPTEAEMANERQKQIEQHKAVF